MRHEAEVVAGEGAAWVGSNLRPLVCEANAVCFESYDVPARHVVHKSRPVSHHSATLIEVFRAVVGSAHGVLFLVSKLALNHVWIEAHFIECG